jgi:hypothetical protein
LCRYCCKSPKLPGDNFPAVRRSDRRPPICVVSITLPRSPVSLSSGDEVPHIFTRKSRLQPGEFLITSAKRLLQQYLPQTDIRWVGWREAYILPPAEAVLLGRMKRGFSQIMTPLASAEAELQSDRAALLRLRSDRGCGRGGCEQFCSDSGRTKA